MSSLTPPSIPPWPDNISTGCCLTLGSSGSVCQQAVLAQLCYIQQQLQPNNRWRAVSTDILRSSRSHPHPRRLRFHTTQTTTYQPTARLSGSLIALSAFAHFQHTYLLAMTQPRLDSSLPHLIPSLVLSLMMVLLSADGCAAADCADQLTCPAIANISGCRFFNYDADHYKWQFTCTPGFYLSGGPARCLYGQWMTAPPMCIVPSFAGCHTVNGAAGASTTSTATPTASYSAQCAANEMVLGATGACHSSMYQWEPTPDMQGWNMMCDQVTTPLQVVCCPAAVDTFTVANQPIVNAMKTTQGRAESHLVSNPTTTATLPSSSLLPSGSFLRGCQYYHQYDGTNSVSLNMPAYKTPVVIGGQCSQGITSAQFTPAEGSSPASVTVVCQPSTAVSADKTAAPFGTSFVGVIACDSLDDTGLSSSSCPPGGCTVFALGVNIAAKTSTSSKFIDLVATLSNSPFATIAYGSSSATLSPILNIYTNYATNPSGSTTSSGCSYSTLPTTPLFGYVTPLKAMYNINDQVTLNCQAHFYAEGSSMIVCGLNGWLQTSWAVCTKLDQTGCQTITSTNTNSLSCPAPVNGQNWVAIGGSVQCQNWLNVDQPYPTFITQNHATSINTWYVECGVLGGEQFYGDEFQFPPYYASVICCPAIEPVLSTCSYVSSTASSTNFQCPSGQFAVHSLLALWHRQHKILSKR